jgi:adenylate cyclase
MAIPLPTRRDLRLGSGLILFVYVASHLANHALGLFSVATAEHGLNFAVRIWQSVPGTLLLYGAAATHIALALNALYRRRTLRMPPLEMLRIALGLGIPILLIGHAVATRLAWEAYKLSPEYSRVVWALWSSDNEGRQLALLVPGWLHGCLGVNFAFGRRVWYQRARPVLFAVALLLPVLGGLGFLAMGKELSADVANRAFLDSNAEVDAATRVALLRVRDTLLALWFSLIAGIFIAREIRAMIERRRNTVVTITYPQRVARVPIGWSILEASRSHHIPHMSMCGGQARCSTCRVQVTAGDDHCPPAEAPEQATLARIAATPGVRLACQLRPTGDISVVPLLVAGSALASDRSAHVEERDLAVVGVEWCNRARFARGHLPQDVVYLSALFSETVGAAVQATGGTVSAMSVDSVMAVFGLHGDLTDACRQALEAAVSIDRALADLKRRYAAEFGVPAEFAVVVHAGHGAIASVQSADGDRLLTAGEVFDSVQAMRTSPSGVRPPIVVSARVYELLALTLVGGSWKTMPMANGEPPLRAATFTDGAAIGAAMRG